ncbi:hypothetical protein BLNAU_10030 [Blattamonas nauphoetae]|uniref:Uncharacterized protein n=1 Tax=Blattamonas nauphoetae TaxID=2049346 RepID=A0ABQ9XUE6_9EUKA|nr:hypothetical protein BLNAU_10030 [Blattamonas nauphoetae]
MQVPILPQSLLTKHELGLSILQRFMLINSQNRSRHATTLLRASSVCPSDGAASVCLAMPVLSWKLRSFGHVRSSLPLYLAHSDAQWSDEHINGNLSLLPETDENERSVGSHCIY